MGSTPRLPLLLLLLALLTPAAQAAEPSRLSVPESCLYFALEVRSEGRLLAQPKLLGEAGKAILAERRQPGERRADYQLVLSPERVGDHVYNVELAVAVPGQAGEKRLRLSHGQIQTFELGPAPGELEISLTLLEVDSPEFRLLMRLADEPAGENEGPPTI